MSKWSAVGSNLRRWAAFGAVVGAVFGAWNLIHAWLAPLSDDSLLALASFYGPMFLTWGIAGFVAHARAGRLRDAVAAGGTVAFATFLVFSLANLVRVNLFLDSITARSDWRFMMSQYQSSGVESLRAYVAVEFVKGAPLKLLAAAAIGAVFGFLGGVISAACAPLRVPPRSSA